MKRRSHWTEVRKPEVLSLLEEAGITGDAAKTILRFERAKTTCWNRLMEGMSWDILCDQVCFHNAGQELAKLNGGNTWNTGQYETEWQKYCAVEGGCWDGNLGDHLS